MIAAVFMLALPAVSAFAQETCTGSLNKCRAEGLRRALDLVAAGSDERRTPQERLASYALARQIVSDLAKRDIPDQARMMGVMVTALDGRMAGVGSQAGGVKAPPVPQARTREEIMRGFDSNAAPIPHGSGLDKVTQVDMPDPPPPGPKVLSLDPVVSKIDRGPAGEDVPANPIVPGSRDEKATQDMLRALGDRQADVPILGRGGDGAPAADQVESAVGMANGWSMLSQERREGRGGGRFGGDVAAQSSGEGAGGADPPASSVKGAPVRGTPTGPCSSAAAQQSDSLAGRLTPETMSSIKEVSGRKLGEAEGLVARQPRGENAAQAYASLGRGYIALGDQTSALRVLDQSVKLDAKSVQALDMRATVRAAQGDKSGAAEDAKAALAVNPKDDVAALILGALEGKSAAMPNLGMGSPFGGEGQREAMTSAGGAPRGASAADHRRADAKFAALAAGIGPEETPKDKAQALLQSAVKKLAVGDMQGALFDVSRALSLDPKTVRAWVLRSHISNLPQNHNYEAAITDADKALALDPNSAAALFEKGYAELMLDRPKDAVRTLSRGVSLEPGSAMGRLFLAMSLEKAGAKDEAAAEYKRAADLDPTVKPIANEALARMTARPEPEGPAPLSLPLGAAAAVVALAGAGLFFALRRRQPVVASH
ncbi:MAG: tetratricopeptide repeat protein [Elusimicrobia bacterium]|nr:tetratricopeptide repeat protein [Elusimicrobiota bacterium]